MLSILIPGMGWYTPGVYCRCGHQHPNLSCKQYTSELTRQELIDLLSKRGYRAEVTEEEGSGYVRITTQDNVDISTKEAVEAALPAGVKCSWSRNSGNTVVPKALVNWYKTTQRYVK